MKNHQESSPKAALDPDTSPVTNPKVSSADPSTSLCLLDETWPFPDTAQVPAVSSPARNIKPWLMRDPSEKESAQGLSTQLSLFLDPWKIKKHLTKSDIGSQCRLLLPTKSAMVHILPYLTAHEAALLEQGGEISVKVLDLDIEQTHRLVLKRWVTRSYVFIGNWYKEFVRRRNLREGDEIGAFWDPYSSRLIFCILARANQDLK
ncbi:PREDICTED: B3 domain-containing protein At2g33720-like [Tarenaya hassleriana]|uniref:B3 domain-containing protein At2g33720-like n=1 Tax=Tarenaya hassleriana TaxID=28532 RepID=UPI00053C2BA7|nr:PREDICTED: B3 domain-containing protein At2g33720-like [Tarenaya hassleriana]